METIDVRGRQFEITDVFLEETDPSVRSDGSYYIEGDWHLVQGEYQAAIDSVQESLGKLVDLEDRLKSVDSYSQREGFLEQVRPYTSFEAKYSYSGEAWGQGEDHADQRLDPSYRIHDLGKVVRDTASSIISNNGHNPPEFLHYVVFVDNQAGGYGHWIGKSQQDLRDSLKGEKLDDIYFGCFPKEKQEQADKMIRAATAVAPDPFNTEVRDALEKIDALLR